MRNIMTVFKKEILRVLKDKRLIFSIFIMPGVMIYILYSLMGQMLTNLNNDVEKHESNIIVINMPNEFEKFINDKNYALVEITLADLDSKKEGLLDKSVDVIIRFDENFKSKALNMEKPTYDIYFNPNEDISLEAFQKVNAALEALKISLANEKYNDINLVGSGKIVNITDEKKAQGKAMAMLLPFLIIVFLFSGAMSIGPDSISGEKERGTIATLLITPAKRSEIVIGKVASLSVLSTISAISSFIGVLFSIPKLYGDQINTSVDIYKFTDFMLILIVLLSTVMLIVGLISVLSTLAKSTKEAALYVVPLYSVAMICGVLSMYQQEGVTNSVLYLVPIYGTVQSLSSIFLMDFSITNILINVFSNVLYTVVLVYLLTKMFKNEKIMFAK